jgi:ApaG protein
MAHQTDPAHSEAITSGIRIEVACQHIPGHQVSEDRPFLFSYAIVITNEGDTPARLQERHWRIIDADGHEELVDGEGVVGKTPRLEPGDRFSYQSFCPLRTPWGTMEGGYRFERDDGSSFDAAIARFHLVAQATHD